MKLRSLSVACAIALAIPVISIADDDDNKVDIGKLFRGDHRVQQNELYELSLEELRLAGMRMFTNPFLVEDGFNDGNKPNPTGAQGQRGSLQNNGNFQRIGGLDGQTCLECHSIISRRTVPMTFGIGGVGGMNNTVLGAGGNTFVDLNLQGRSGGSSKTNIDGRVINPPFIFGAGGIELLANEMTIELHEKLNAGPTDGTTKTYLTAKGVDFGYVIKGPNDAYGHVTIVENGIVGVRQTDPAHEDFLVVQPFGRKGDEKSTRTFDIGALSFHFGMGVVTSEADADAVFTSYGQVIPVTTNTDHDGDNVHNEVTQGELSALSVFVGTAQTPFAKKAKGEALRGRQIMDDIGCTECHIPKMETNTKLLGFRFPEIAHDPTANVHTTVDLTKKPMSFKENGNGGITVELFADLKRHYMGESLEEFNGDGMFTTMRLWGVADTAPYLHDGRAFTIRDAILHHGGVPDSLTNGTSITDDGSEAFGAVSQFVGMSADDQNAVLAFLDTLRSPNGTFKELDKVAKKVAKKQGVAHDDDD